MNNFSFDDFSFNNNTFEMNMYETMGIIQKSEPKNKKGYCCDIKMEIKNEEYLICKICKKMSNYIEDYDEKLEFPDVNYYSINGKQFVKHYPKQRNNDVRIDDIYKKLKEDISFNREILSDDLIKLVSINMFNITKNNTVKSENRKKLFATLIYYYSIELGYYMTPKEACRKVGLQETVLSKGKKYIIKANLENKINLDISKPIYKLIIEKYLKKINIYTSGNMIYCTQVLKCMLHKNIAYDATIQSKCIGVIYYLLKTHFNDLNIIKKQKTFSSEVNINENTFITVYNALQSKDVESIIEKWIDDFIKKKLN